MNNCSNCVHAHADHNGYGGFWRCDWGQAFKGRHVFPASSTVITEGESCEHFEELLAFLEICPKGVKYRIEPWEWARSGSRATRAIGTYDEDGTRVCKQIAYSDTHIDEVLSIFESFEKVEGEERRDFLKALGYSYVVIEACAEQVNRFVAGEICGGQLARLAHEIAKELRHYAGAMGLNLKPKSKGSEE